MAYIVVRAYKAMRNRFVLYQSIYDTYLTKDEISIKSGINNPNTVRGICDDLIIKGNIECKKVYNKAIKRWVVKYKAVHNNPVPNKTYEQMLAEYEETKSDKFNVKKKGKWDDLIASNPNLRIIKNIDREMQPSWTQKKTKSYFRGIGSSFNLGE